MQLDTYSAEQTSTQRGFTLLEVMAVVVIFGIIMVPLFRAYDVYVKSQKRILTVERIENAVSEIRIFRPNTFAYPCPADRTLGPNDLNYGLEDCAAAIALAVGNCTAGNGICKVAGSRNADGVGGLDPVLIGALPFRTMDMTNGNEISVEGSLDGWGNKLTYAVSANTTRHNPVRNSISVGNDFKLGVITAVDEFGNNTAGIGMYDLDNADGDNNILTGADGDGQFAVISHGETGRGAYSSFGVLQSTCDTAVRDGENCDNDSVFMASLGDYKVGSATFFDDTAQFYRDQAGDLWAYIENPNPAIGGSTGHVRKLNLGKVGVNTGSTAAQADLDVNGNIRATTTQMDQFCKKNGTACIPTRFMWETYSSPTTLPTTSDPTKQWKNTCAAGQVISHYANGQAQCISKVNIPAPMSGAVTCPAGSWVRGLLTNGCVICGNSSGFEAIYPSAALCNN